MYVENPPNIRILQIRLKYLKVYRRSNTWWMLEKLQVFRSEDILVSQMMAVDPIDWTA
jgi:hypothetical protein